MKLIIERTPFGIYAYRETERHHARVEPQRAAEGRRVPVSVLDDECELSRVLNDNDYIVVTLPRKVAA
jgi:hypothetical protein